LYGDDIQALNITSNSGSGTAVGYSLKVTTSGFLNVYGGVLSNLRIDTSTAPIQLKDTGATFNVTGSAGYNDIIFSSISNASNADTTFNMYATYNVTGAVNSQVTSQVGKLNLNLISRSSNSLYGVNLGLGGIAFNANGGNIYIASDYMTLQNTTGSNTNTIMSVGGNLTLTPYNVSSTVCLNGASAAYGVNQASGY
jgi:hypothetical protein